MFKFRKLKLKDEKGVRLLMKQLTNNPISFRAAAILKDKKCKSVIIKDEKKIIGFGSLVLHIVPCRGYVGTIEDVVIDERYRGQGLGKKLVIQLLEIGKQKKIKTINLTSNPKRLAARKLYESLGFKLKDTNVFQLEF
jgi:phosphinothricin acetyltransferase